MTDDKQEKENKSDESNKATVPSVYEGIQGEPVRERITFFRCTRQAKGKRWGARTYPVKK